MGTLSPQGVVSYLEAVEPSGDRDLLVGYWNGTLKVNLPDSDSSLSLVISKPVTLTPGPSEGLRMGI